MKAGRDASLIREAMASSAMESFLSSLKTERTARKVCRTRDEARADLSDDIERFLNLRGAHSKPDCRSLVQSEARAMSA